MSELQVGIREDAFVLGHSVFEVLTTPQEEPRGNENAELAGKGLGQGLPLPPSLGKAGSTFPSVSTSHCISIPGREQE